MNQKRNEGFTLLELIIVVGIIGVLTAICVVKFVQLIDKARESAAKANLGALRASVSIYFADTRGMWPRRLDTEKWSNSGEVFPAFLPTYIRKIPKATLQRSNPHANEDIVKIVPTGVYGKITPDLINDKGGWIYSSTSGDVRINCNHRDSTISINPNSTIYYSNYGQEM